MAATGATTSGELRSHNRVRLLRAVHDCGASRTRSQLTRELELARGTASVLVGGLLEDALLHEEPSEAHGRGRPTQVPGPHPQGPLVLAVDLREDAWEIAACELGGRATTLETRRHDGTPEGALTPLGAALRAHLAAFGGRVVGVGVSVAGPVRGGTTVDIAHLRWQNVNIPALLALTPTQTAIATAATATATTPNRPAQGPTPPDPNSPPTASTPPSALATASTAPATDAHAPGSTRPDAGTHAPGVTPPNAGTHATGSAPPDADTPPAHSTPPGAGAHATGSAPRGASTPVAGMTSLGAGAVADGGMAASGVASAGAEVVPLFVGNDARLAGLAEARRGRLQGVGVGLHLHVDFDLGGTLLIDGRPLAGATGTAGEFGHMPLVTGPAEPEGAMCMCGAPRCWSLQVGGNALLRAFGLEAGYGRGRDQAERILGLAADGDAKAVAAVAENARALGSGTSALVNALDPAVVTLSGTGVELFAQAEAVLMAAYTEGLMAFRRHSPALITPSALGTRGPLMGAMESVFDAFLTTEGIEAWRQSRPAHP